MDEETKLFVDMLKGVSLAAVITALFRDGSFLEKLVYLLIALGFFLVAWRLVRRGK